MPQKVLPGLVLLTGLSGCFLFGSGRGNDYVDPTTYADCQDPEGRAAWQRAKAALLDGGDQQALADLVSCTRLCPDLVRAHLAYQDAARRLGGKVEQDMVDFYVDAAERRSPVPAYLRARLADTAYAQSNALDAILAEYGSFAWAYLSRARVHRGQGRLSEALQGFEAALVHDPELFEGRHERAQVLTELGRNEEAAIDYAAYLQKEPQDLVAARAYVSLLLYRLARIDEAMAGIRRLEAAGDRSIGLRMDRAAALWRAGQPRASIDGYLEILDEAPRTARAALNIGLLYYEVVSQNEVEQRRYWPKARVAFQWFLLHSKPSDGHEQFERTMSVPYRLRRIDELLGRAPDVEPTLAALRWPDAD